MLLLDIFLKTTASFKMITRLQNAIGLGASMLRDIDVKKRSNKN